MTLKSCKIVVGDRIIDEAALMKEKTRVQNEIKKWAKKNDLWFDSGFAVPFHYYNDVPLIDETILLLSEGPLAQIINSDSNSFFNKMLESLGYWLEPHNHYSFLLHPNDEQLQEDFLSLHRWQWLQKLAEKKLFELHTETFEHFAKHPESMKKLGWRQFEELLNAIFKNQGFSY